MHAINDSDKHGVKQGISNKYTSKPGMAPTLILPKDCSLSYVIFRVRESDNCLSVWVSPYNLFWYHFSGGISERLFWMSLFCLLCKIYSDSAFWWSFLRKCFLKMFSDHLFWKSSFSVSLFLEQTFDSFSKLLQIVFSSVLRNLLFCKSLEMLWLLFHQAYQHFWYSMNNTSSEDSTIFRETVSFRKSNINEIYLEYITVCFLSSFSASSLVR